MFKEVIKNKKILLCVGAGGVGKTTSAAALALGAASLGFRSLVLTIDPAKRLANSLGLKTLGHDIQKVDLTKFGIKNGSMSAMMLDQKKAFDEMVRTYSNNPESTLRILENPIYKQISSTLAGAQEYAALTKLQQFAASDEYDLVVVDTPPTAHALDFLEAPQKLAEAIDSPAIEWFRKLQNKKGWSLIGDTGSFVLKKLATFVGSQFIDDISSFFTEFNDILGGFKTRADEVFKLLQDPNVGFTIVFKPEEFVVKEALKFYDHLKANNMPFVGFVCNRVHPSAPLSEEHENTTRIASDLLENAPALKIQLTTCHDQVEALAQNDRKMIAEVQSKTSAASLVNVPLFHSDVHAIDALQRIAGVLLCDA